MGTREDTNGENNTRMTNSSNKIFQKDEKPVYLYIEKERIKKEQLLDIF